MQNEEWRNVVGYGGKYQVSNLGRVRSLARNYRGGPLIMKQQPWKKIEYLHVTLMAAGVVKRLHGVHVLVLEAFVGARPDGMHAAHLDGDPRNNCLSNLVWITPKENNGHKRIHGTHLQGESHGASKTTEEIVRKVRADFANGMRQFKIAEKYNLTRSNVGNIVHRKDWKHI